MKNPWITHSTTEIFDNPWIEVTEHDVTNPGGGKSLYGKVHFKGYALGILALDEEMNTWIVGQWRYPLNEYSWELPMGGGPLDEDKLASAKKELREETGITATKWKEISKIHLSNSVTDEVGYGYLAQRLTFGETAFEETEDITIKKLPFKDAVEMCLNGEITDSLSVATILGYALKSKK
jgi:ADP-ribose pyrophosphatase